MLTGKRPERSGLYPWYDSGWLTRFATAQAIIRRVRPQALAAFVAAFEVLRTRPDFGARALEKPFDDHLLDEIRAVAGSLRPGDLELHEARRFGRFVVHDHPAFDALQRCAEPIVGEVVGEAVEASYSFLSLYGPQGVCPPHMDAPEAKWTLDLCVDQSAPWPLHVSQTCAWPEPEAPTWPGEDWESAVKHSPSLRFAAFALQPGQAVVFSGSSQWHYRDPIPAAGGRPFCDLLFLHFIPRGTADLVRPERWARRFGIAELGEIA